jgi:hypothetical protein
VCRLVVCICYKAQASSALLIISPFLFVVVSSSLLYGCKLVRWTVVVYSVDGFEHLAKRLFCFNVQAGPFLAFVGCAQSGDTEVPTDGTLTGLWL